LRSSDEMFAVKFSARVTTCLLSVLDSLVILKNSNYVSSLCQLNLMSSFKSLPPLGLLALRSLSSSDSSLFKRFFTGVFLMSCFCGPLLNLTRPYRFMAPDWSVRSERELSDSRLAEALSEPLFDFTADKSLKKDLGIDLSANICSAPKNDCTSCYFFYGGLSWSYLWFWFSILSVKSFLLLFFFSSFFIESTFNLYFLSSDFTDLERGFDLLLLSSMLFSSKRLNPTPLAPLVSSLCGTI